MAMRVVTGPEAVQGSSEWLRMRRNGIGASEVPAIMGTGKFGTAYDLFLQKTGRMPPKASNWAMERGQRLEVVARAKYEDLTGEMAVPMVVANDEIAHEFASLDGLTMMGIIVEIKCPGREAHEYAMSGRVPPWYVDQVQYQLAVTGCKKAHYYSFDGENGVLVVVERDEARIAEIRAKVAEFWGRVQAGVWEDDEWAAAATIFLALEEEMNEIKARHEAAKQALIGLLPAGEKKKEGSGVSVTRSSRKGAVDYDKLLTAKGVTLAEKEEDEYRKAGTESVAVKVLKTLPEMNEAAALLLAA